MKTCLAVLCLLAVVTLTLTARQPAYDLVVHGGRAIDPETSLDAVRDIGIVGGRIAAVSAEALTGREEVDARGLVVSPGFIDLHTHVNDAATYRLAALDGVTTALDLEIGVLDVPAFYDARRGKSVINFGTAASHPWARVAAFGEPPNPGIVPASGRAMVTVAADD
jgi:N-acyl-D-glutamate deacylase